MRSALVAISATVLIGCDAGELRDLAVASDWELVAPEHDPWPDRPVDAPACPDRTAVEEAGSLEIDTNLCSWVTVTAASAHAVEAGSPIELLFFHSALAADEPAEAVIGISIGDTPLWSQTVAIPAESAFYAHDLEAPTAISQGDPLVLHVHNHGNNTYQLGHLRAWVR